MPRKKTVGVGIIGFGASGMEYAAAIRKNRDARLAVVADTVSERRERACAEYGASQCVADYRGLLDVKDVGVACVCTPHHVRRQIVTDCLEAGKHVIVEKPLASSVSDVDAMVATAQRVGKRLFVGHNHRFIPSIQRIREMIRSDAIGAVFLGTTCFVSDEFARMSDTENWKGSVLSGGGVLIDNCVNVVDTLRSFLGDVVWVMASGWQGAVKLPNKGEDSAVAQLGFVSGAVVDVVSTFAARWNGFCGNYGGASLRYDFYGERGSLHFSSGEPVVVCNPEGRHIYRNADAHVDSVKTELEHFLECIESGRRPIVTAHDGREALRVVEAAYASMKTGARVPIDAA